jgi:pilus assembly protein CpaC
MIHLVLVLCTAPASVALASQEKVDLALGVGEQRVVSGTGVSSYSEGGSGIIDVRLTRDGSSFVVVGQRPGVSTLLLIMDDGREVLYRVTVSAGSGQSTEATTRNDNVGARDNIRLDFYFVQLSRDYNHRVGVAWPASFAGGTLAASFDLTTASFTDATAVIANQALPRLDMAQSRGWAKLLRQAALITENGTQAKFAGGGELNVAITGGLSNSLRQISFGSQIEVLPRYDRHSGRVELEIHADVSDLAADHGTGVPGRVTSTLSSVVNLELGQSVVLAGLQARSEASDHTGVPWLSQIPILGALFGTHTNKAEETQNLVVIVPTVVDAVSQQARERLREALAAFEQYSGDLAAAKLGVAFTGQAATHDAGSGP